MLSSLAGVPYCDISVLILFHAEKISRHICRSAIWLHSDGQVQESKKFDTGKQEVWYKATRVRHVDVSVLMQPKVQD